MKIYLVGGAIRDKLLGLPVKERDYVVENATPAEMEAKGFRQVGKDFPVFIHPTTGEEYALARTERKVSRGYTGFTFNASKGVSLKEDLLRRDLTINAMAEDEKGEIIDPYQGQQDLSKKILRHVSPAFSEDPVRILRVARFYARFKHQGFSIAPETLELMEKMVKNGEVNALVAERVWKELARALSEKNPEAFFEALEQCGALYVLFPMLQLDDPGLKALSVATVDVPETDIRFAALLYHLSADQIRDLCRHYRVPNDHQALAKLTQQFYQTALKTNHLSADLLLSLLSGTDVFRREKRFEHFLKACSLIATAKSLPFSADVLRQAALLVKKYDIQPLIKHGLTGKVLADAIAQKRKEILAKWLSEKK